MCLLSCSETGCWALAPGEDLIAKLGIRVNPIISFIYLFISKHAEAVARTKGSIYKL